jgi:hypothetical protein
MALSTARQRGASRFSFGKIKPLRGYLIVLVLAVFERTPVRNTKSIIQWTSRFWRMKNLPCCGQHLCSRQVVSVSGDDVTDFEGADSCRSSTQASEVAP